MVLFHWVIIVESSIDWCLFRQKTTGRHSKLWLNRFGTDSTNCMAAKPQFMIFLNLTQKNCDISTSDYFLPSSPPASIVTAEASMTCQRKDHVLPTIKIPVYRMPDCLGIECFYYIWMCRSAGWDPVPLWYVTMICLFRKSLPGRVLWRRWYLRSLMTLSR